MKLLTVLRFASVSVILIVSTASVVRADNAPVYETPQGLGPGVKDTSVRMANEQVDVQVVEQGAAAVAVVNATFTMSNSGPTTQLLTGFPDADYGANGNPDLPSGGYQFTSANITNFRAWTDSATFTPKQQQVSSGQFQNEQWFVWNMSYPQGQTVPVHVAYQQHLGDQQVLGDQVNEFVDVLYVLRTGALWAGNIDDAHITFEAPNGGGFVGADGASTSADDHIVWDFTNFKPTADVGTVYVFATPWKEMQAAEAAANQPGAQPNDYLRAAQDAILLLQVEAPPYGGIPPLLANRYGSEMEQWAANAQVLNSADSWKTLADSELFASQAMGAPGAAKPGVRCWPDQAASDFQQAADLGSDSAANELANLHEGGGGEGNLPGDDAANLPSCGS